MGAQKTGSGDEVLHDFRRLELALRASSFGTCWLRRSWTERIQDAGCRQAAHRILARALEEASPVSLAVHIPIEQLENLRRKVAVPLDMLFL
jgi:hypothetical protein